MILYIGGFLSIYALTGDTLFRDKAIHVAEHIFPAFEIGGGYSCTWYHTKKGVSRLFVIVVCCQFLVNCLFFLQTVFIVRRPGQKF